MLEESQGAKSNGNVSKYYKETKALRCLNVNKKPKTSGHKPNDFSEPNRYLDRNAPQQIKPMPSHTLRSTGICHRSLDNQPRPTNAMGPGKGGLRAPHTLEIKCQMA